MANMITLDNLFYLASNIYIYIYFILWIGSVLRSNILFFSAFDGSKYSTILQKWFKFFVIIYAYITISWSFSPQN